MKKIIIAGGTGMIGRLIIKNCLASANIEEVTSLVRKKTSNNHPKLKEVVVSDFNDYSGQTALFENVDAAFFCIGVYTGQVPDAQFRVITVDYALAFGQALKDNSPKATLCLLSGAGADRTEKSRTSFAKYKGIAENSISNMNLGRFYAFRPGYIYPVESRKEPNMMYRISRTLYPLIKLMGKNSSIKSTELALAMFNVGQNGAKSEVLENRDILEYV
ncbi:MAG: NAD(P)H-binding protein [Saprospiraceae bacterium]